MSKMQREKGKAFERRVARLLRELWPNAVVRRASQAERADNPDVFIESSSHTLSRLWLEMQDARRPTPTAKLDQAVMDAGAWHHSRPYADLRLPFVVWHKLGERDIHITTRLWVIDALRGNQGNNTDCEVTISWTSFVWLLCLAVDREAREAA
jgi:hypothetical protein